MGLYDSFGVSRFSFVQSWLIQANRLANSQASASNAGVPGDPNLPKSNSHTWPCQGVVLLVSHQEDWFRHDRLSILNVM